MVVTVAEFNKQQEKNWQEYVAKCEGNGVKPQPRNNFNQFILFEYKQGYVATGKYPIYKRRRRDLAVHE